MADEKTDAEKKAEGTKNVIEQQKDSYLKKAQTKRANTIEKATEKYKQVMEQATANRDQQLKTIRDKIVEKFKGVCPDIDDKLPAIESPEYEQDPAQLLANIDEDAEPYKTLRKFDEKEYTENMKSKGVSEYIDIPTPEQIEEFKAMV
eukprot:CAMPEP_0201583260 /NCGR_PEP_ID=MMETSP0190_2-20130828/96473_1 /ASSEMBLY_ACC=CAM_ASM_000263 /TAXON_ID=37353 /ORGANISM="Rosalina sp." /LENGTH=147 /DNA_ID=CAMNT_0048024839 /DNA_START=37 /DNA_END=480 /DNA_ORIENTATION=+